MTLGHRFAFAVGCTALALTIAGCGRSENQVATPSGSTPTPTATSATPTPTPSPTPTATASPTATSTNAPLKCPDAMAVAGATDSALVLVTTDSPTLCAYASNSGKRTASIQSEAFFGGKSLKRYRAAIRKGTQDITVTIKDRPDFGKGAFMLTLTAKKAVSGPISSLIVPRPGGQFASISASKIKDGILTTDVELTEQLARAFLDN